MILYGVYQMLGMLEPYAHGDSFGFQFHAGIQEETVDVARGVSGGQYYRAFKVLAVALHARYLSVTDRKRVHSRLEADLAPTADNGVAHCLDYLRKSIGADVRVRFDKDFRLRPVLVEYIEHLFHGSSFFAASIQLAVGVCSRAPFAKAVVGIGVNLSLSCQSGHVETAGVNILAAFQHYRLYTKLYQLQCGKQSGGSRAHNYTFRGVGRHR